MRRNELSAMNASVTKPSSWKYGAVHGATAEHDDVSANAGTRSTSQWYSESGAPIAMSGNAYQRTAESRRTRPTRRIAVSGYMAIRWYQHSSHGMKCATSE